MKAFVVIATKGRPKETYNLLSFLSEQIHPIEKIIIVGSESYDVEGLSDQPFFNQNKLRIIQSEAGLTLQRNAGLNEIQLTVDNLDPTDWFVVFFDDDFRPAKDWIKNCSDMLNSHHNAVGVGGKVLADGAVTGVALSEEDALSYLNKIKPPQTHLWSGSVNRVTRGLYGCNMAIRGTFARTERFDENLPLYGWQEDVDYTIRAMSYGQLYYFASCEGVHMGVTGGRTSGVRFGYSQIANPIYLTKKGTLNKDFASKLMWRNVLSNLFRTLTFNTKKDYRGRLYGNFLAFLDILGNKCHPLNVKKLTS